MHPFLFSLKRRYRKEKLPDPFAYLFKWFGRIPVGVLQVGANSGQEINGFVSQGLKIGVFVEPLQDAFKALEKKVLSHEGFFAVNALCAEVADKAFPFYASGGNGASSSLLKPVGHLIEHPSVKFESKPTIIHSTTVDRIAADLKAQGHINYIKQIDMLHLDTQGSELSVLRGAEELLKQVNYIFTEVSHGGLYENDVNHKELTGFLESRGFSLVFLYMNRNRWGDALYVHNSVFKQ
jgi:FkbM family methyltransferase